MSADVRARAGATRTWQEAATSGPAVTAALAIAREAPAALLDVLLGADEVIYTGAGSSYYIAQSVAWVHREMLGRPAIAVALSELLLRPAGVLSRGEPGRRPIVVVSRSGTTSEAVDVATRFGAAGHPIVAVTCRPAAPLASSAPLGLVSPLGDETAVVMTRSFTSMLALLLRVVARLAERAGHPSGLGRDLDTLPDRWPEALAAAELAVAVAAARPWSRVVVLGGGPAFGIASEAGLKLTETSQVPADPYAPLEFRHGPLSVSEPDVLVLAMPDPTVVEAELAVVREAAALGATGWVLGPADEMADLPQPADAAAMTAALGDAGAVVATSIGAGLHPLARLPLLLPPVQALALAIAVGRGRDPDAPRHIGQVVVLDG